MDKKGPSKEKKMKELCTFLSFEGVLFDHMHIPYSSVGRRFTPTVLDCKNMLKIDMHVHALQQPRNSLHLVVEHLSEALFYEALGYFPLLNRIVREEKLCLHLIGVNRTTHRDVEHVTHALGQNHKRWLVIESSCTQPNIQWHPPVSVQKMVRVKFIPQSTPQMMEQQWHKSSQALPGWWARQGSSLTVCFHDTRSMHLMEPPAVLRLPGSGRIPPGEPRPPQDGHIETPRRIFDIPEEPGIFEGERGDGEDTRDRT